MEGRTGTPLLWHKLSSTLQLNPLQGETRHNPTHAPHTPSNLSVGWPELFTRGYKRADQKRITAAWSRCFGSLHPGEMKGERTRQNGEGY